MTWRILLRGAAERDVESARDWYERRRAGLGDKFLDDLAQAMAKLQHDPNRERYYYRNFRRILLKRFPYKVFYQVVGEDRVIVFRVLHARQAHDRIGS